MVGTGRPPVPTMYAAGVLPICWVNDVACFLVGRDARDDTWSDFAGKCEKCDKDIPATAAREFWEESYGVLMDAKAMRSRIAPGACIPLKSRTQNQHAYYCFVVEVPFVPYLRTAFAKHLAFLRQRNVHRVYIEKTDAVYVTLEELMSDAFPKRSVFRETIAQHRETLEAIAAGGPQGWAAACAEAATSAVATAAFSQP